MADFNLYRSNHTLLYHFHFICVDVGLETLLRQQDELQQIKLTNLPHLTCKGLEAISSPCLEEVDLFKCSNVSDKGRSLKRLITFIDQFTVKVHVTLVPCTLSTRP